MMTEKGNNGFSVPHEIIWDVLKELPVKTLLRFRCVSKLWRSIIDDDPLFVQSHHNRSITRPGRGIKHLLLISRRSHWRFYSADSEGEVGDSALHLLLIPQTEEMNFPLYSVKGLICYDNFILNPNTREHKLLPLTNIKSSTIDIAAGYSDLGVESFHLLGFDRASGTIGKHKVLNITQIDSYKNYDDYDDELQIITTQTQFKVLTLGGCGHFKWRDIDQDNTDSSVNSQLDSFTTHEIRACCVNDIIYCLGSIGSKYVNVILAFEVGPESFKIMPLPPGASSSSHDSLFAIQVRERLALINTKASGIWILEDYGKRLWDKRTLNVPHKFFDAEKPIVPLCSVGGEILFRYHKSKYFYYDLETETAREDYELSKVVSSFKVEDHVIFFTNHVESLFRLKST